MNLIIFPPLKSNDEINFVISHLINSSLFASLPFCSSIILWKTNLQIQCCVLHCLRGAQLSPSAPTLGPHGSCRKTPQSSVSTHNFPEGAVTSSGFSKEPLSFLNCLSCQKTALRGKRIPLNGVWNLYSRKYQYTKSYFIQQKSIYKVFQFLLNWPGIDQLHHFSSESYFFRITFISLVQLLRAVIILKFPAFL